MNLRELMAKASPARSGDELAGIAAASAEERARAQMALADVPLNAFLAEPVIPYETDEVTRLICDSHDDSRVRAGLAPDRRRVSGLAAFGAATAERLAALAPGHDAGDGGRGLQDHAAAGPRLGRGEVPRGDALPLDYRTARPARHAPPAQPSDRRSKGIAASILDGLSYGNGDAVIGINPADGQRATVETLLRMLDRIRESLRNPDADLRAGARDHADGGAAPRRARWTWCSNRSPGRRRRTRLSA